MTKELILLDLRKVLNKELYEAKLITFEIFVEMDKLITDRINNNNI